MVKHSAFIRDCVRHVRSTADRFLAIFCITALGVAFFAGLKATAPDMRLTAQKYFNDYGLMDVRVVSTAGLTSDDLAALKAVKGVSGAQCAYSADASVTVKDGALTVKLLSLDTAQMKKDPSKVINRPWITSGRLPDSSGEVLADPRFLNYSGLKVGDTVKLGTDGGLSGTLKRDTFTIVGVANDPLYSSYERGSSTIGSGRVDAYLILPDEAFSLGAYTDIYLRVAGADSKACFGGEYTAAVKKVRSAIEKISSARETARYDTLKAEGQKKIDEAAAQLAAQEKTLTDASQALADAQTQIDSAPALISTSRAAYNGAAAQYAAKISEYNTALAQYDSAYASLSAAKGGKTDEELKSELASIESAMASLPAQTPGYAEKYAALSRSAAGIKTLLEKTAELSASQEKLAATKTQLDAAAEELARNKAELDEKAAQVASSQTELDAEKSEFDEQNAQAQPQIAAARQSLADASSQLGTLKKPTWYVLGRDSNEGFVGFRDDADRIAAIANVFPLIFFLVAVLVSLTAMTRLVENDRTYIGTLKALGIGRDAIALKYTLYAALASGAGGTAGLFIGYNLFPRVIFAAYCILYTMPPIIAQFNVRYAVISLVAAGACATLPALFVCLSSLHGSPAGLMRPKAPVSGKRILLERIKPVWSRMNFSQKVTARNLFRYKKRLVMTIVGVAGCTALVFTGFGLKDAIMPIVDLQYGRIRTYSLEISLKDGAAAKDVSTLGNYISTTLSGSLRLRQQSVDAVSGGTDKSVYLVVPENGSLKGYINLSERVGGKELALGDDSVVVTEKLAKLLNLKAGGRIDLRGSDGAVHSVKISGIAENYIFHYVYMSPKLYRSLFNEDAAANVVLCKTGSGISASDAAKVLMKYPAVSSVTVIGKSKENFGKMIVALNFVVIVLIISAALLAFVVLLSLTSINIDERRRELATIKVLGFYDRELSRYVYRENVVLTLISSVLGIVLGIFLQKFVITTAEVDIVMFSRAVSLKTYLFSAGLTLLFALLANVFMYRRIVSTDMVSSLKSGE